MSSHRIPFPPLPLLVRCPHCLEATQVKVKEDVGAHPRGHQAMRGDLEMCGGCGKPLRFIPDGPEDEVTVFWAARPLRLALYRG